MTTGESRAKNPALTAAFKLLSRRDHFRRELVDRLEQRGFHVRQIDAAISRCVELDLVDDERLAERFVKHRAVTRGWGPRRLAAELRRRGVDQELVSRVTRLEPGLFDEALQHALDRVERRAPEGWWRLHERRGRMVSSLVNRGFDTDDAYRAVMDLATEREKQLHAIDDQSGDPLRIP
jgi:regulatory protein